MNDAAERIAGSGPILLLGDHASNRVPPGVDLGIDPALLDDHIAVDIGIDPLSRAVAAALDCPAILARVSRLVVDLHRRADEANAIPEASDGHAVPGNVLDAQARSDRIDRFWRPYHRLIAETIERAPPRMLLALHSFTPRLRSRPDETRPWELGILYNNDDRAARIAIDRFRDAGIATGDNEPYSGRHLNATMDAHAEARGIPYLVIEVRQDLIGDDAGVQHWARRIVPVIRATCEALA